MKKKLFAILLSIVMVAGLLPATALAAEPTVYDIWVDGVQVTSENKDNLFSGTVSYDPTTHTLFLNNATLDNDTMSDYGIKTTIPSTLKIRLTGTNSITRTDPGGGVGIYLNYSNSVEITGDGTLVINVIGENYDGISTGADVKISDKARVIINSEGGLGITGRMVKIDGATVDSTGLYAGIDAHWLKIINGADVTLKATQDGRNGAYIWKDQEGNGGDIELAASKVKATSYYPGLFAAGNLTVDGGQVSCTSTADGALWARGNILIKGGAKVTTDGKYPMGGNGTFTVEEAEIDAKNTNENNIPAIFDESVPVIADGYHLNYAKAVDSEGTEIDLLSSGTQYFALYKNVHFITKAVHPVSFVVTPDGLTNVVVKVNGQEVTGSVSLEAGTYPVEVTADNCKAYTDNITITADAATHTQTIAMTYLPADYTKVDAAIDKANALNKDEYKDFTAVEAAVNAVVRDKNITEQSEVDAMAKAIEDAIAALQYKDADYTKVDAAIAKANALNKNDYKDFSGVEAAVKAVVRGKNITEQTEVDTMAKAIEDAIAALQYKDADYTKVDAAIAKANALKKDDYKDFSAVETAINAVVRDKNIMEQSEVDKMAKAIEDAIVALVKKPSSGGGSSSGGSTTYPVATPSKTENGTVTVSPRSAEKGDSVTITVKPDSGYQLDELTVTDKNGKELKLTDKGNGKYTFTMPASKVEINATFVKEIETSPFSDVSTSAYYYEAVKWAQEKGITGGIGNGLFGPNQPCTRAQIVTFLWRAAGSPEPKSMSSFSDVSADSYYAKAVAWAVENGITTGTGDGKFSPDATCTRAQSVTFLFRAIGKLVDSKAEFSDVLTDSYYANAVAWAVENGVTNGIGDGLFGPNNSCTRAQIVTFLFRAYQGK